RVTELTHNWLNFGYIFISSKSVNLNSQKACINLLRKSIEIKDGSSIKVSDLNEVIKKEINVSSQVIKQLIQANYEVQIKRYDGYEYWIGLDWKKSDRQVTYSEEAGLTQFDENVSITDSELLYEEDFWEWDEEDFEGE
ncbi:TPA: DNA primase, partial [Staphylococcus aureus]|nr:DNA primase [Staphylococcus aureus]